MNIHEVRARYREVALDHSINPRDVDLLLAEEIGKPVTFLISHGEEPVDDAAVERFCERLQRRIDGEPMQYIRGRCEFFGREFVVDTRALIPRPETELIVEAAIDRAPRGGRVLDIGTGSGCVAISLERERPDLRVSASDVSIEALAVAAVNRRRLGSGVRLFASNLLDSVRGKFATVVSNPPYVPEHEIPHLQREVRLYEPRVALTPGGDGLSAITTLLSMVADFLEENGFFIFEIGYRQVDPVLELAQQRGWTVVETRDDLAGIPRVIVLSR